MATNGGRRTSAPGNNSSLILGILVGMVLGLAIAGGVAWHLSKRPTVFTSKEQHETAAASSPAPAAAAQKPPVTAAGAKPTPAASAVGDGKKNDYTFYKILTDEESPQPKGSGHKAATTPKEPKDHAKAAAAAYFLQAGSFASADDADKLKAKLALLGMEASVQSADVSGKGKYYRVRLGPYASSDEVGRANATLKQNGINDAATIRGQ